MDNLGDTATHQNINALYGTFNIDMLPINTIDVTDKVRELVAANIIAIPAKCNFNELFGSNIHGQKKYLQISAEGNIYNIAEDEYIKDIRINFADTAKHIKIVYYLYVNPNSNWRGIVSGQLFQLKSYGILSEADLYIHITDCYNIKQKVVELIKEIVPEAILSFNYENLYEYPGLKLIYDLSNQYPQDNFIYFHAKGMSYNVHSRSVDEITLFEKTFEHWRKNIQFLNENGIKKIGLFPAIWLEKPVRSGELGGWVWYNYWYATGEYLSNCPDPLTPMNRYYYESWLARYKADECYITNDCLSLYKIKSVTKNYFTPAEADYHLNLIPKQKFKISKRILQVLGSAVVAHYYLQAVIYFNYTFKSKGTKP